MDKHYYFGYMRWWFFYFLFFINLWSWLMLLFQEILAWIHNRNEFWYDGNTHSSLSLEGCLGIKWMLISYNLQNSVVYDAINSFRKHSLSWVQFIALWNNFCNSFAASYGSSFELFYSKFENSQVTTLSIQCNNETLHCVRGRILNGWKIKMLI